MSFNNIKFTTKGRNLHAKVQAGAALNFTRIAVGDGDNGGASSDAYDALLNQIHNINITKLKSTSDGSAIVGGVFNNSGLPAFYLREIGLFATDPDLGEILYCYGNAGATAEHIPEGGGSTILERQLNIVAIVGNATSLTANIDYSMYATMEFVQDEVAAHDIDVTSHDDIRQQINSLEALINFYHTEKYLYNKGDECVDLTGGWRNNSNNTDNGEKLATSLKVAFPAGTSKLSSILTTNRIDLTNYSYLKCRVKSFAGTSLLQILNVANPTYTEANAGGVAWVECNNVGEFTVNVSAINNPYYIAISSVGSTARMLEVDMIWLER